MQERQVRSLVWEDPLVKEMAVHSNILAWEIPWTEEPSGLQFTESRRLRHNLVTKQQQQRQIVSNNYLLPQWIVETIFDKVWDRR